MSYTQVSTLIGAQLNLWTAKACGYTIKRVDHEEEGCRFAPSTTQRGWLIYTADNNPLGVIADSDSSAFYVKEYSPSTDWSQGGPIIEREHYTMWVRDDGKTWVVKRWPGLGRKWEAGTLLIAAMRCFVASKFGEEVDHEL